MDGGVTGLTRRSRISKDADREFFLECFDVDSRTGCWNWTRRIDHLGYGHFRFRSRTWKAHRVAWTLFRGEIPAAINVLHRCDNRRCVNPDHLFLGTQTDNMQDCAAKGRTVMLRGESNPFSKLNDEAVREIRAAYERENPKDIAARYGIASTYVWRIATRKAWGHVA